MSQSSIYQFTDYKAYVNEWVSAQPKQGFGEYRRMATSLQISTTMVSQVFKSDKHLSLELASDLCDYLRMDEDETEYFLLLVDHARAGSHKLQKRFERQIKARQEKAKKLENRVKATELGIEEKSVFYSSWIYQGVRMLTDLQEYDDADAIAKRLNLPKNQIQKVLDFLIQNQLVMKERNSLKLGNARTHVGSSSPLVSRHHQNWRLQGLTKMVQADEDQFFYTAPMTLSSEVANWIRQELPSIVERINAKVIPSPSETVRCLNIDWFEY
ncbi:MAG: TIGR02147 family protein [Bdellovibrionaceae bacterium]|nr:TIGR02147 family protein [Pseudobdellovibrionaceae bacterium]